MPSTNTAALTIILVSKGKSSEDRESFTKICQPMSTNTRELLHPWYFYCSIKWSMIISYINSHKMIWAGCWRPHDLALCQLFTSGVTTVSAVTVLPQTEWVASALAIVGWTDRLLLSLIYDWHHGVNAITHKLITYEFTSLRLFGRGDDVTDISCIGTCRPLKILFLSCFDCGCWTFSAKVGYVFLLAHSRVSPIL